MSDHKDALLESVNTSAQLVRGVFLTFMLVSLYLAILVGSTDHKQLLMASDVPLPLMEVGLPIVWIYALAPWIYVVLHFNLLQLLRLLSTKLQSLKKTPGIDTKKLRELLYPLPFVHWQTQAHGRSLIHGLLILMVYLTLVVMPLGLLLWIQIRFLPYHDEKITWYSHRMSIMGDLVLLWLLWPKIKNPDWQHGDIFQSFLTYIKTYPFFLLSLLIINFSFLVATYPGETAEQVNGGWELNQLNTLFDRNLDVRDEILVKTAPSQEILAAYLQTGKTVEEAWNDHAIGLYLSGRNLTYANLTRSKFYNARFVKDDEETNPIKGTEAKLDHAILNYALLQNAKMAYVSLVETKLIGTQMQGANMQQAQMQGADMQSAQMQGAYMSGAQMQGANMYMAQMQGADMRSAQMQGAYMQFAQMQGADMYGAQMQGAYMSDAQMQGAYMSEAQMQSAYMPGAQMRGADMQSAQMQGAYMSGAQMQGANFQKVQIFQTNLVGTNLLWSNWNNAVAQRPDEEEWKEMVAEIEKNSINFQRKTNSIKELDEIGKRFFSRNPTEEKQDVVENKNLLKAVNLTTVRQNGQFEQKQAQWLTTELFCSDFYIRLGLLNRGNNPEMIHSFSEALAKNKDCQKTPIDVPKNLIERYNWLVLYLNNEAKKIDSNKK